MEATHFIARKRKSQDKGFAITLYRFKENGSGTSRPQYLGPLGWSFHLSQKDSDVIKELQPIDKLEGLTGDNLEAKVFTEHNIYAG